MSAAILSSVGNELEGHYHGSNPALTALQRQADLMLGLSIRARSFAMQEKPMCTTLHQPPHITVFVQKRLAALAEGEE